MYWKIAASVWCRVGQLCRQITSALSDLKNVSTAALSRTMTNRPTGRRYRAIPACYLSHDQPAKNARTRCPIQNSSDNFVQPSLQFAPHPIAMPWPDGDKMLREYLKKAGLAAPPLLDCAHLARQVQIGPRKC
jgi:hypothetical protein